MLTDWLGFARGPLFIMCFLFMLLGLLRLVVLELIGFKNAYAKIEDKDFLIFSPPEQTGDIRDKKFISKTWLAGIMEWLIPVRHIYKSKPFFSIVSIIFHIAIIVTPIFLMQHILLWKRGVGVGWPGLPGHLADVLTVVALASIIILFLYRLTDKDARVLSGTGDYLLLALIFVIFGTGLLAAHPAMSPVNYSLTMLIHVLAGNLSFVLLPLSKLAHVVLFPFNRVSSDFFWRLPPGMGDKVAHELHGEEAKV